ncbi:GDSL esterase/lipase [Erysiphe necator]|nr:GDSL esterase/lipase [Erysiphe necator]
MSGREQFILFGDSLIERANLECDGFQFVNQLENALDGRYEVIAHGYPGANTYHALDFLKNVIPSPEKAKVRFLAIWFGTNDADKSRPVSIENFEKNLISIINSPQLCAHLPDINIILITPPPVEESLLVEHKKKKYGLEGPPHLTAASAAQYAKKIQELVQELKSTNKEQTIEKASCQSKRENKFKRQLEVLDVWGEFISMTEWREGTLPGSSILGVDQILSELLIDGVHLTTAGYKIVLSAFYKLLRTKWAQFICD